MRCCGVYPPNSNCLCFPARPFKSHTTKHAHYSSVPHLILCKRHLYCTTMPKVRVFLVSCIFCIYLLFQFIPQLAYDSMLMPGETLAYKIEGAYDISTFHTTIGTLYITSFQLFFVDAEDKVFLFICVVWGRFLFSVFFFPLFFLSC